ncbi:MAG: fumarylacetoacetate hydrolase family protein [Clostridia bacterium]|nr:fumarylacetoacetate hydrolase family protein [Clostridia bacterium]
MKLARFTLIKGQEIFGVVDGELIKELENDFFHDQHKYTGTTYRLEEVSLLAPTNPSKIICIGVNYKDHAKEMNSQLPSEPLMFMKPNTTIIGPLGQIEYPEISKRVDYEGELAVVIKAVTKKITPEEAPKSILGYTCANDVTARDLQLKDGQWTRGKSFDTFLPIGPWIETELDPNNAEIYTRLNGEKVQHSNTNQMVFPVYQLVSTISQVMTLLPGDVIITGTPSGVGQIQPGDRIEVTIEGIGSLVNTVVAS